MLRLSYWKTYIKHIDETKNLLSTFEFKSYGLTRLLHSLFVELVKTRPPLLEVEIDFAEGKLPLKLYSQLNYHNSEHTNKQYLLAAEKLVDLQIDLL